MNLMSTVLIEIPFQRGIHIEMETSINSEDASLFDVSYLNLFLRIQRNTNAL